MDAVVNVERSIGSLNRTTIGPAGSTAVAPEIGSVEITSGATTSRRRTTTAGALPALPAASLAAAFNVSAPPVGGNGVTFTVNVSVRDVAGGETGRVSEADALPLAKNATLFTPTSSVAVTLTATGLRGSINASCAGL